jgi:hypothetical protein
MTLVGFERMQAIRKPHFHFNNTDSTPGIVPGITIKRC